MENFCLPLVFQWVSPVSRCCLPLRLPLSPVFPVVDQRERDSGPRNGPPDGWPGRVEKLFSLILYQWVHRPRVWVSKMFFFPVGSFSVAMFGVGYPPIPPPHTHWTSLTGPCREASGPHIVGSLRSPHTHTGGLASYMPQRARRRWKRGSWNARKGFCRRWFVNSRWSAACRVMPDG